MRAAVLYLPLLSVVGVWSAAGVAQTGAAPGSGTVPARYAAEPLVIESLSEVYRMEADGTGVYEKTVRASVQTESALKTVAVINVPFAAKSQHVEWVYARLRHKDGSVTETPLDGVQEVTPQVTREAPFYSDLKDSQLPLKNLRVGDDLEWKARVVRTTAEAKGEFWEQATFIMDGVVLEQTVELNAPKGLTVNAWSRKGTLVESDEHDRHRWVWTSLALKPTVGAEADAAKEAEKKRVRTAEEERDAREGKLPDVAWTTFKSWEDVGAWYRGLETERIAPDAAIKAKVAQVTAGKTTDEDKVQAVYAYVATQIHYIGVSFGVGRYQPHRASEVLDNQYGDCKDKHTLLAAMLTTLGYKPEAVLTGAGIRFNEKVPSPGAFNHLMTRVSVEGKPVWLDSTAEVAPFGMLIYQTRDRDVLVVPEEGAARVMRTPADPPFVSRQEMVAKGALDTDGTSQSRITLTFRGDSEVLLRSVVRQLSPAQYDQLAQQICSSIGYIGTASHMSVGRVEDLAEPLSLSFDYKREKSGDWPNLRVLPQLAPVPLPRPNPKDPPVESLELGVPRVESSHAEIKLPQGWTAELPEAVHVSSAWVKYDLTYQVKDGAVISERKVEVLTERVPVADWKAYGKVADKADWGSEFYIQLVRPQEKATKAGGKGESKASIALKGNAGRDESIKIAVAPVIDPDDDPVDASAGRLVQDAFAALQQNDVMKAKRLAERAKALNGEQPGLWALSGTVGVQLGAPIAAIEDFQKELKLHPSELGVYEMLANAQITARRPADAKETLRRWVSAAPDDPAPGKQLAGILLNEGDAKGAAAAAEAAMKRMPKDGDADESLELLLGNAQMQAGMKEQAHVTLEALLKQTDNPDIMNDAAYELADAGFELPLAEEKTRAAVEKLEEETWTWTLDENTQTLRARTQFLQATWDTMGWIEFKKGDLKQAEQYIRAAWQGRQTIEVGKHLGEIEIAKGNQNAALSDMELAGAVRGAATAELRKEVDAETEKLRKEGAQSQTFDAAAALERMRKLPLGAGADGVAEYKLLLDASGLVKAEPTGEKQVTGALEKMKRAKVGGFLPQGSKAQLVFVGILNCHAGACELVLEP